MERIWKYCGVVTGINSQKIINIVNGERDSLLLMTEK